jgi:WhiB family transcriptional regulator, redox-sensing transcriptional regulator
MPSGTFVSGDRPSTVRTIKAEVTTGCVKGLEMHWQKRAICGGARAWLFFGPDGETGREQWMREGRAKAVCAVCPVREECLDYALQHHVRYGIWGGLNEHERHTERLRRARQASVARR